MNVGKKYLWDLEFVTLLQVLGEDFNELLGWDVFHGDRSVLVDDRHFDLVSISTWYLTSIVATLELIK